MANANANTTISMPMPTPGSSGAPLFKGKHVSDFISTLEVHADTAGVPVTSIPSYVLRYCHRRVRIVIESSTHFTGQDWPATKQYLLDLYSSEDLAPRVSPEKLRVWVKRHAEQKSFTRLQDVDRYYREFSAQSTVLLAKTRILASEVDLLFYQGIPNGLRSKIKRKLPAANMKRSSPPTIPTVLGFLRREFDEDDLDAEQSDIDFDLDSSSDSSDSSSDDESDVPTPKRKNRAPDPPKKKKKSTKIPEPLLVPAVPVVEAPSSITVDNLTKQMEELKLNYAKLQRSLHASANTNASTSSTVLPRCFICWDTNHRVGITFCPEVPRLVTEGLAAWTPQGRLARPDMSELPRAPANGGGVSKALRDERAQSESLKGKARERELPPHLANARLGVFEYDDSSYDMSYVNSNSIQYQGEDILTNDVYAVTASSSPVTRSQDKKDNRHDPLKRPEDHRAPQTATPKPSPLVSVPNVQANRPAPQQPKTAPKPSTYPTPYVPPKIHPDLVRPQAPNGPPKHVPPHPNTQDAWRETKTKSKAKPPPQRPRETVTQDYDMADGTKPPPKPTAGYHFTSSIQDMTDVDAVQKRILDTCISLPLRDILGVSAELQKRFANLTKTRRDYVSKTVSFEIPAPPDSDDDSDAEEILSPGCVSTATAHGNYETTEIFPDDDAAPPRQLSGETGLNLACNEGEDEDEVLVRYSSAVSVHQKPLFAMTTGRFDGILADLPVKFMVDSGSELNLISNEFFLLTNLALDLDGSRWSLKGINGGAVPLVGCCRDTPVVLGGHRFDHHFFVSAEGAGKQEVILGQPWLQWYSASLAYSRSRTLVMRIWKNGDADADVPVKATLAIHLCNPNAPRNAEHLILTGRGSVPRKSSVEDASDDEAGKS